MVPRWAWWTLLVVASLNLAANFLVYEYRRQSWHPDVTVVMAAVIVLVLFRLRRRP